MKDSRSVDPEKGGHMTDHTHRTLAALTACSNPVSAERQPEIRLLEDKLTGEGIEVKMTEETTFGAQRILAEHTDSMRKQRIPLGPAITIPFFITMFLWLFI